MHALGGMHPLAFTTAAVHRHIAVNGRQAANIAVLAFVPPGSLLTTWAVRCCGPSCLWVSMLPPRGVLAYTWRCRCSLGASIRHTLGSSYPGAPSTSRPLHYTPHPCCRLDLANLGLAPYRPLPMPLVPHPFLRDSPVVLPRFPP